MATSTLLIAGKERSPYRLAESLHIYDGDALVGTIEAAISKDGHELRLDRFTPSPISTRNRGVPRKLVLVEVLTFLAEQFETVATIRLTLNTPFEGRHDALKVASARAQMLGRISAEHIQIIPNLSPSGRGDFTVEAIWKRCPQSLGALREALHHERASHEARRMSAGSVKDRLARLGARIKRLLSGSPEDIH
ncbi:hypothetical protein LJR175_006000 [Variovorax sp. LjRoot175]|uniref:hypothetical protein n=1 Tax=Variovorax sp. LjRoot175 TaxID=3342276 RepID=UPI003ED061F1